MAVSTSPSGMPYGKTFWLDSSVLLQFDDPAAASHIAFDRVAFLQRVEAEHEATGGNLVDGYAPFCKHVFIKNFAGVPLDALNITPDNQQLLRSGYTRRRPEELPVLARWFSAAEVEVPTAKHLDLILYSREQMVKEYEDMPVPWAIICGEGQDEDYETPMQPITAMRNALGREEGGSGVPIDKAAYEASAEYWQTHATIITGTTPSGE
eukprot:gene16140-22294_t